MICVQSAYIPEKRKTETPNQWIGYLNSKLKELRGFEKHKDNQYTNNIK